MKEEIRNTEKIENKGRRILTDEELEKVAGGLSDGDVMYGVKCTACGHIISGGGLGSFTQGKQEETLIRYNEKGCPDCGARNSMGKITGYWSYDAWNIVWNS